MISIFLLLFLLFAIIVWYAWRAFPIISGYGAKNMLACSGDLLLEALVACAGVTLTAVATAIGIEITDGSINAEGDLDFRGTLGVSKEVPVGFKSIRLNFSLTSNATAEQMESLIKLTERYCVVYQTIANGASIKIFSNNLS